MIKNAKSDHINTIINNNQQNPRVLFSTLNKLLGKSQDVILPRGEESDVANKFCEYFTDKINKIRSALIPETDENQQVNTFQGKPFTSFKEVTEDELMKIILSSKPTSCVLDPIPTSFMLKILDALLPILTAIINNSLNSGFVPQPFKHALIKPLLKKPSLESEVLKNYRPVSNLPFISKILEKVVKIQLVEHMQNHSLMYEYQSAYRNNHSTETALNHVFNTIRSGVDQGSIAMLVLLDLSAAFDTLDHSRILNRLESEYGISGLVLNWFSSYLIGRTQAVMVNSSFSNTVDLACGVPQGSVLGPIIFCMYTKSLSNLLIKKDLNHHFYADDSQIMDFFLPEQNSQLSCCEKIETCVTDVKSWMTNNMLKLNSDKTELLLIAPTRRLHKSDITHLKIEQSYINPSKYVKNLGVIMDTNLSMENHISFLCKTCHYHLRNIGSIRHFITSDAAATLVRCLILSRLDYCNSVLSGIANEQTKRLQRIQNSAARLVSRTKVRDHISPVLSSLHWLRINERIEFKLLCLTYQAVYKTAPVYLQELVNEHLPVKNL
ncbi:hypothetical protein SNE40_014131 [Patella caerulea]|uniref:Reverse transcriptase domain-containing protein n=1 Tax=Patella caerulea TaxID=87958 RepID=A0AAN8PIM7_PATCE